MTQRRSPSSVIGTICTTALIMFAAATPAHCEAPDRSEIENLLLMTRSHLTTTNSHSPSYDGIWAFDPSDGDTVRMRPFFATAHSYIPQLSSFMGTEGHLTTLGDELIYQSWPFELRFDLFSNRIIGRRPVPFDDQVFGWALQGDLLDEEALAGTGLQPGLYGNPMCILKLLTFVGGGWAPPPTECTPVEIPGTDLVLGDSNVDMLLRGTAMPSWIGQATVVGILEAPQAHSWTRSRPAYDGERRGFWHGDADVISFHPARGGLVESPSEEITLNVVPQNLQRRSLLDLHHHPVHDRIFGYIKTPYDDYNTFFALDPETGSHQSFELDFDWGLGGFPVSFASLGRPPETHTQLVPIIAEALGSGGTPWTTDLWLFNPAAEAVDIEIWRLTEPETVHRVALHAGGSREMLGVLSHLGGGASGDGVSHDALFIRAPYRWGEQIAAVGRIHTVDSDSGGTYGHVVPAVPAPYGYSNHQQLAKHEEPLVSTNYGSPNGLMEAHLDLDLRNPGQFRHNIGVVNVHDEAITIRLIWGCQSHYSEYSWDDLHPQAEVSVVVPPRSVELFRAETLWPQEVVNHYPARIAVFGEKPAAIWLSMVDTTTQDATFVPYTSFGLTSRILDVDDEGFFEYRLAIPAVAHTPGRFGSSWMTDLYGYQGPAYSTYPTPLAMYHPRETGICAPPFEGLEIRQVLEGVMPMPEETWCSGTWPDCGEEWRFIFPDVVRLFDECWNSDGTQGGLEIVSGSWFAAFSRTYTTRPDGGTYGSMLPPYPPGGWPVQHFAGLKVSPDTRVNIGFFNGNHEHTVSHQVTLFDTDGNLVSEQAFDLEALDSLQKSITDLFNLDELQAGVYGLTVLPLDDEANEIPGRSWAYVSIVDNRTNDPMTMW